MNMGGTLTSLRNIWGKNWPEVRAAVTGGLPRFILWPRPSDLGPAIPVFCYHIVNPEEFESDLEFLSRNGYVTIDADTLLDHFKERREAPHRSVVLSFDDGERNLYEVAFPSLRRYDMKAVAFIATRFHQDQDAHTLSSSSTDISCPLSWSQIRQMHESGVIDFQSHTHEHRYIPRWPEPADLEGSDAEVVRSSRGPEIGIAEDFQLSKETLEQKLNKTVSHLAFPCFNGTKQALFIGQRLGYKGFWWGVLPHRPDNRPGHSPLYIVRIGGRYLRRLPGNGREPLFRIMRRRYRESVLRFLTSGRNLFRES
jgi:peptidoglycan/xylan/chitin deacetylase (PgdA/CDA1 family)